jgi:hypothetical protein
MPQTEWENIYPVSPNASLRLDDPQTIHNFAQALSPKEDWNV